MAPFYMIPFGLVTWEQRVLELLVAFCYCAASRKPPDAGVRQQLIEA